MEKKSNRKAIIFDIWQIFSLKFNTVDKIVEKGLTNNYKMLKSLLWKKRLKNTEYR